MATLFELTDRTTKTPTGRWAIQFAGRDGERKTLRLGRMSERAAEKVLSNVEDLIGASVGGASIMRRTAEWLAEIDPALHERIARLGLCQSREPDDSEKIMLLAYVDSYIDGRADLKPLSIRGLKQTRKALAEHFGAARTMKSITANDAENFRTWLAKQGYAQATTSGYIKDARQFYADAVRRGLLTSNPFALVRAGSQRNESRKAFVPMEQVQRILDACPDHEWRLIVTLSRIAGLRCPSETLALEWADIDWEHGEMLVRSCKTEHHEGKAQRRVPIFPELLPHLRDAFEQAEPGTTHVITRYRDSSANLRTQLLRIMRRAKVLPWEKLFHNMRASRQTELCKTFPLHVVCEWLGNSVTVADAHYLTVDDSYYREAAGLTGEKAALQNALQQPHATARNPSQSVRANTEKPLVFQRIASHCQPLRSDQVPATGLEPVTSSLGNRCSIQLSYAGAGRKV